MRLAPSHAMILAVLLAVPPVVPADVLVLTDGTRLEGRVEPIPNNPDRVAFVNVTGRLEFPRSRIREIIEESDAEDFTRIGRQHLDRKSFPGAVQMFQRALEADRQHQPAIDGLAEAQAAIDAAQREQDRQRVEAFARELESVAELITLEKFDEGAQILEKIQQQSPDARQQAAARQLLRDLFLAWGESRYDRMDNIGAEEKFQRVIQMDPQNERARDRLLLIWRNDPQKKAEVLKAYLAKLEADPNNIEFNRIAGDLLYEFKRYREAIPLLARVAAAPAFARSGYDQKLVTSYQEVIQALADEEKLAEAIGYYREMLQIRPNMDSTPLTMLEYRRDRSQLAEDDWDGKALLIRRLLAAGMTTVATEEAELILRYAPNNAEATRILRELAAAELRRVQEAFAKGEFAVAINIATTFMRLNARFPDMVAQADEIKKKAEIQFERQRRSQQQAARELADRGIEAYNEALRNAENLASADRSANVSAISPKQRAIEMSRRAIDLFETALKIDPSLGDPLSMDLNTRLRDARALHANLTAAPYRPPRQPLGTFRR
jgi:hypothetical protein